MFRPAAVIATCLGLAAAPAAAQPAQPLDLAGCVRLALAHSAKVQAAHAEVAVARAQADQIDAALSTKVRLTSFAAPLYGADGGFGLGGTYRRELDRWGPYLHADAQIVKPIATFGRASAGSAAASARTLVEVEKARERSDAVRAEVARLYALRLYALSMATNLDSALQTLRKAVAKADEMYASGSGEIALPELSKLRYGALEVERFLRQARDGAELAERALKQAAGMAADATASFADDRLTLGDAPLADLAALVAAAQRDRPEFGQLRHGKAAVEAWEEAERTANRPVLFVAAQGAADWSPVRPRSYSAISMNAFNDYYVGVAVGVRVDADASLAAARAGEARAKAEWVAAQARLAETGIPLQVFKARQELASHCDLAAVADEQVKVTRKWAAFAAAAYAAGTGEAKDLLEGVGAHLLAKKAYYDHLLAARIARAELDQAIGARP